MKLIAAVSFAFIYKYFSTFLTFSIVNYENFVSEDWFNTTAINNEFKIEYCTRIISNFSSRKRAIPTFRSTKWSIGELFGIAHHLPDHVTSRARWALRKAKNWKPDILFFIKRAFVPSKRTKLPQKTSIQNETLHMLY